MATVPESSDRALLDLLRSVDSLSVSEMVSAMGVTATAVRQRLNRLMGQGLVQRQLGRSNGGERGRPGHRYSLSEKGRRTTGANFADLAIVLWKEIRGISDSEIRRGMLKRLAKAMADMYAKDVVGSTPHERMDSIRRVFGERDVPFSVDSSGKLPVLKADACPYPELAEQDRGICAMEKMLFSELLEKDLRLSQCRLDGANCCTFEVA